MIEIDESAQGGRAVDGTETGWGRPAEPGPRWRALLDRARHGSRSSDDSSAEKQPETLVQDVQLAEGTTPATRWGFWLTLVIHVMSVAGWVFGKRRLRMEPR